MHRILGKGNNFFVLTNFSEELEIFIVTTIILFINVIVMTKLGTVVCKLFQVLQSIKGQSDASNI